MVDDGVVIDVTLDLGAVALDQGTVIFKRLDQLQNAAHIVGGGLAQLFELFIDDHGADAIVHINFQQQSPIDRERQDVRALNTFFAGLGAVLQIKSAVGGQAGGRQRGQQLFGRCQGQLGVDGVVFAGGFVGQHPDAGYFGQKDQLVGLQLNGHAGGHFFHGQVKSFASRRKTKGRKQHHRTHVQRAGDALNVDLAHQT